MNIHEHQAKGLLAKYGVAVPRGAVVFTPEEAEEAVAELGGPVWVVKAQIHAGGRGKGGGVKLVKSAEEAVATATDLLGMQLITHQTGPEGKEVKRVYIEEGCDIARELYLGMLIDRATARITVMASAEGGVEIEEVAAKTPEKILKITIDPAVGMQPFHGRKLAFGLGLEGKQVGAAVKFITGLYRAFVDLDASMAEINEGCDIARELYLGMLIDRATARITVMASAEGGVEIEEVAAKTPEKILKITIDPAVGMQPFHGRKLAFGLGLEGKQVGAAVKFITGLYRAFVDLDASLAEINPLVVTASGDVVALDAKMNFDDNALFRHPDIAELRDEDEEDPAELEASKHDLNYIRLDGNIGCMVNGAGLAMATMDILKLYGGDPANFLDVGGGATAERVTTAFKLILSDPKVEGILVNIFGGIMRCDIIAGGITEAVREVSLHVPLVVRLEGTNVELGKKILNDSGLPIAAADDLADAARKIVKAVGEAR